AGNGELAGCCQRIVTRCWFLPSMLVQGLAPGTGRSSSAFMNSFAFRRLQYAVAIPWSTGSVIGHGVSVVVSVVEVTVKLPVVGLSMRSNAARVPVELMLALLKVETTLPSDSS